ncbi:MAG: hypothetical protein HONBIEJF_00678 [Fimbriimonadaceae bacterium]|nr:hypothetical protein [Fimbriimonadaceae bacterium]
MRLHPLSLLTGILQAMRQVFGLIVFGVAYSFMGVREDGNLIQILFVLGFGLLFTVGSSLSRYLTTRYEVTPSDVVIDTGWIWKRHRVVPRARIQEVHVEQKFLHRILDIVVVKIESAGTGESEVVLDALSRKDADRLKATIFGNDAPPIVRTATAPRDIVYSIDAVRIMWSSMLENRALYLIAGVVGLLTPLLESDAFRDRFFKFAFVTGERVPLQTWIMIGLFILIGGWLFSIGLGFWQYHGFRIERHPKGLQISHGLVNLTTRVISPRRVQGLTIIQGFLYKLAGLYSVTVQSAGVKISEGAMSGQGYLSPAATAEETFKLADLVFPGLAIGDQRGWRSLPHVSPLLSAVRTFLGTALLLYLPIAVAYFGFRPYSPNIGRFFDANGWALWAPAALSVLFSIMAFGRSRAIRYRIQGDFMMWRRRTLTSSFNTVPISRLQFFEIAEGPLQRKLGLLSIKTAVPGVSLPVDDVGPETVVQLRDEALGIRRQHPGRGV